MNADEFNAIFKGEPMGKISAIFNLFRRGEEVSNAAAWKNRTVVFNLLLAIVGVLAAFGYRLDLDNDTLLALAGGVVALGGVVDSVMHVITDHRVGLPPSDRAPTETGSSDRTQGAAPDIRDPGGA